MSKHLFIGVDGGASKCVVRLEDEQGQLIGRETSGPATIRFSINQAWASIHAALNKILNSHGISLNDSHYKFHAGMGLAGCEIKEAYSAFLNQQHAFETLVVASDAKTACLGAHGGKDGAIIIVGTGLIGYQLEAGNVTRVGGFGFPHDDKGGGAWLGLKAIGLALQWYDKRVQSSGLAEAVYDYFHQDIDHLVTWANNASSTEFATLAALVIHQSKKGDTSAINLLKVSAKTVLHIGNTLCKAQQAVAPLPVALIGGIAPFLEPYLDVALRTRLRPSQLTPDQGAILLVKDKVFEDKYE